MTPSVPGSSPIPPASRQPGWLRFLKGSENSIVALALGLMVVLPLADIFLRKFFRGSISGSIQFVQNLTLTVSMLGGAIAAREGRLLTLSPLVNVLRGGWKAAALIFSNAMATAICALLCAAGVVFVRSQMETGEIAYGVQRWWFELLLPVGFGAVALRLAWHSSKHWWGRGLTLLIAGGFFWFGMKSPVDPAHLVWPGLATLAVATALGAPIFTTLGGAAMILLWGEGRPVPVMLLDQYDLVTNPILPSLPLFTLAGYFLAEGGASRRLVRVFQTLVGRWRGGTAMVTALICAFFTSFTGASGVTILALGGLLMPVLIAAKYSERNALGLFTSAGSLGLLFPPSLPLILYAIIAQNTIIHLELPPDAVAREISINTLFLAGFLPGMLQVALTFGWGVKVGAREPSVEKFNARDAWQAIWEAKWELLLPVMVMAALFSGLATPVEAAALTALYAFIVQTFVYRDLKIIKDVPRVMTECGLLIGGVLLILGVAMGLTGYLIFADVPSIAVEWIQQTIHSKIAFLLLLNVMLLVVGCLMDIFSAIVVIVPLIVPMAVAFGIDPVHLGVIFLANMELGYLTPPVGMNLFMASYRFGKPVSEISRAVIPLLLVRLGGVLVITYVPWLSTVLPAMFQ